MYNSLNKVVCWIKCFSLPSICLIVFPFTGIGRELELIMLHIELNVFIKYQTSVDKTSPSGFLVISVITFSKKSVSSSDHDVFDVLTFLSLINCLLLTLFFWTKCSSRFLCLPFKSLFSELSCFPYRLAQLKHLQLLQPCWARKQGQDTLRSPAIWTQNDLIDTSGILNTLASDVHVRLKTTSTAIKIARDTTNNRPRWVDTSARDTVRWYWSVDTLFWQLSVDHNMAVQYQVAPGLPNVARKCEIKHWFPCVADGRTVGRSVYGHVITKFSRMNRFT